MINYKILTDTGCDLPFELLKENAVDVIGMVVNFNGEEYIEDNWKKINIEDYYNALRAGAQPTTSQITPTRFYDFFKPYLEKGEDILYIGFSSTLSGTFGAANIAKEMLLEKFPERKIELIDSNSASVGVGLLVLSAAQKRLANTPLDELIAWLENAKQNINHIFTVDDLNHLKRGGRVSGFSATVGTMLSIKPILYMSEEGKLLNIDKVKGRKKSIHTLSEYFGKGLVEGLTADVLIAHGNCDDDAALLKKLIEDNYGIKNVLVVPLGMTIGAHTGANVINMVFFGKTRELTISK
ncbi:MAG: DegV family protein [Clostridiaceae bacterium]